MRFGKTTCLAALGVLATFAVAACGPKYPNCEEDKHCKATKDRPKDEFCFDKLCRECVVDTHCAAMGPCANAAPTNIRRQSNRIMSDYPCRVL